jgi:hypothetical protein
MLADRCQQLQPAQMLLPQVRNIAVHAQMGSMLQHPQQSLNTLQQVMRFAAKTTLQDCCCCCFCYSPQALLQPAAELLLLLLLLLLKLMNAS